MSIETITLAPFALAYFVILPQLLWSGIQRLVQWRSDWRANHEIQFTTSRYRPTKNAAPNSRHRILEQIPP